MRHTNDKKVSEFTNMLSSYALVPLIDLPTRVTPQSSTLIDNIITNIDTCKLRPFVLHHQITDHYPILCILSGLKPTKKYLASKFRDMKNFDIAKYRGSVGKKFNAYITPDTINAHNYDMLFNKFVNDLQEVITIHAPLRLRTRKEKRLLQKPWVTKGIRCSIKTRDKLHKNHYLEGNAAGKAYYKKYSNILTRVKDKSKRLHFMSKFREATGDSKLTWKLLRQLVQKNKGTTLVPEDIVNPDSNIKAANAREACDIFNSFFPRLAAN